MLDELLDSFQRDRKGHSGQRPGGVRGMLGRLLGGDDDHERDDRRRYADDRYERGGDDDWDEDGGRHRSRSRRDHDPFDAD